MKKYFGMLMLLLVTLIASVTASPPKKEEVTLINKQEISQQVFFNVVIDLPVLFGDTSTGDYRDKPKILFINPAVSVTQSREVAYNYIGLITNYQMNMMNNLKPVDNNLMKNTDNFYSSKFSTISY